MTTEQVIDLLVHRCPISHPDLAMLSLNGSQHRRDHGPESDIDIFTILHSRHPEKIDLAAITEIGNQLNHLCQTLMENSVNLVPIVVATIRLEEAQVEMARLLHPGKQILPLHWLHHPSVEFLITNEPPELADNLLRGEPILGKAPTVTQPIPSLGGLDWLTDSFRVLIANFAHDSRKQRVPNRFLLKHALHNLDYFWKWKIIPTRPDLKSIFDQVHALRHQGERASFDQVVNLHQVTFDLWPTN